MRPFFSYYNGTLTEVEEQLRHEAENNLRQRIMDVCSDIGGDPDWMGMDGHVEAVMMKLKGVPDPSDDVIAQAIHIVDGVHND